MGCYTLQIGYRYKQVSNQDSERAFTHAPPRALQYRVLPLSQGGLRSWHVSSGSRPHPLIGRALMSPHVSWLQTYGEGSGASRVLQLRILPPYRWALVLLRVLGHGSQT
jgi:hypothetical protein